MHRVCRLVTHRGLIEMRAGGGYPNLDHKPLMENLLDDVRARAKVQLLLTKPEISNEEHSTEAVPATARRIATDMSDFQESTAAMTLYSCGYIGMRLSQSDIDILSSVLLNFQPQWTDHRVVMVLLGLGKLGVVHGQLKQNSPTSELLDALYMASEERIGNFSADELSTLVSGFASVDYAHLKSEFLTKVMAAMLPKIDKLPLVGMFGILEGLMMLGWVAPAPKTAWQEVENNHTHVAPFELGGGVGGSSGDDTFRRKQTEDSGIKGSFQVKDLRELQSLAKAWEQQRRSELAEFLEGQQQQRQLENGASTSPASSLIQHPPDHQLQLTSDTRGGNLATNNLGALAQRAMRARAERASKAQLSDLAAKVAKDLRSSVIATKDLETPQSFDTRVLTPNEQDDALIARLLTGEWEDREKTEEKIIFNDDSTAGIARDEKHSRDTSRSLQNEHEEYQNQQQPQLQLQQNSTRGRRRRRIFRMGPLLAKSTINPLNGREIIKPHYERAQLWDPLLLQPSQHASEQNAVLEDEFFHLGDDDVAELERRLSPEHTDLGSETLLPNGAHDLSNDDEDVHTFASQDDSTLLETTPAEVIAASDALTEAAAAAVAALAQRARTMVPDVKPSQAINFARYLSALRHCDRDLLIAVRDKIEKVLENYNPLLEGKDTSADDKNAYSSTTTLPIKSSNLADFLWTFASLGIVDLIHPELSRKVIHAALHDVDIPAVALSRAAWSLAVLGHLDGPTMKKICARIVVSDQSSRNSNRDIGGHGGGASAMHDETAENLETEEQQYKAPMKNQVILKQLFQAALQVEIATGESHQTLLPAELRTTAAAAWNDRRNFLSTSYSQRQVAGVLENSLGLNCELEHVPESSFVVIDIAVFAKNNTKVAVEVDGPYHYSTNKINHKLGAMQLRDSLLRHSGWEVVSIPYYEWMQVKSWERAKYLKGKVMPILENQRQR